MNPLVQSAISALATLWAALRAEGVSVDEIKRNIEIEIDRISAKQKSDEEKEKAIFADALDGGGDADN